MIKKNASYFVKRTKPIDLR